MQKWLSWTFGTKRTVIHFLKKSEVTIDVIGLVALLGAVIIRLPMSLLGPEPATGGDTGSHFWSLVVLVKHAIPHGSFRAWSPGNLGGEPILVNYFPLPFLIMALISLAVPLGTAFNIGTILPALIFPLASYVCLRGLGTQFPTPLFGATLTSLVLLNESYSMFGGNLFSTLAGQFAHLYALDFLLLGIGMVSWEIRTKRRPLLSTLSFSAVFLSHGYVFLGLPFVVLGVVCFYPRSTLRHRFFHCAFAGILAVFISLWFLIPLLKNAPWTTAYADQWDFILVIKESFGIIFLPGFIALVVSLGVISFWPGLARHTGRLRAQVALWFVPLVAYLVFYIFAKRLGLVNVRAVPQILVILALITACTGAFALRQTTGKIVTWLVPLPLVFLASYWGHLNAKGFGDWASWNYSSWKVKPLYPDLIRLSSKLKGDFSMPRVIYENSDQNNGAGTLRVFEMLPYFAERATLESVYLQSTLLAPMAFHLQAEVSRTPSCPFASIAGCPKYDIIGAMPRLKLMGVGQMILNSSETIAQVTSVPQKIQKEGTFGIWTLFKMKDEVQMVETFSKTPEFLEGELRSSLISVKPRFIEWFSRYNEKTPFLVAGVTDAMKSNKAIWNSVNCRAFVKVDFDRINLSTTCPGIAHYLKFAYHPFWRADTGDSLFLVSPGFLGIIPTQKNVSLNWQAFS